MGREIGDGGLGGRGFVRRGTAALVCGACACVGGRKSGGVSEAERWYVSTFRSFDWKNVRGGGWVFSLGFMGCR